MAACISSSPAAPALLSSDFLRTRREKPTSLSWSSSFPHIGLSMNSISNSSNLTFNRVATEGKWGDDGFFLCDESDAYGS